MVDVLPYIVLGFTRKKLKIFNIGKRIEEIFGVFEKYLSEVMDKNHKSPCSDENEIIHALLDPKNGFDEDDVRDEFITILLGVSSYLNISLISFLG